MRVLSFIRPAWPAFLLICGCPARGSAAPGYNNDIRPILADKCFACHGPDAGKREADLRLDVRDDAIRAGAIVPGEPEESTLISRIHAIDPDDVMPPPEAPRQLDEREKNLLESWIRSGAGYEPHWAFVPPPAAVPVPDAGPPGTAEIDRFVLDRLRREDIDASPPAPPERWLRRVSHDLTGLPPSAGEIEAYLADTSPGARERAVDRLLASPRYGEHMAVGWLDAARYADSFGYQSDIDTHAWPYRDWVIRAHNENLPWNEFITWQLAGDLLENPTRDQMIATAFNRIHRKTQEGGSVEEEFRQEGVADRVHTFGTAFLALTMECARCHDHKYDPIPTREYYSLGAFFNSIDEWGLLHGIASIQPHPTLLLTTPEQDKRIASAKDAVAAAEVALRETIDSRGAEFRAWLGSPVAPDADLSGAYELDSREKDSFPNSTGNKPATSNARNTLVPGHKGQALRFTGDDPLALGDHGVGHQEHAFTVSFFMKPAAQAKRSLVFHNSMGYDPGYHGFELLMENGRLRWMAAREWPGHCIAVRTRGQLAIGEWTHVSVSYDGSSKAAGLKVFLNGGMADVDIVRDNLVKNCGGANAFTFGERVRDSGFKDGEVDAIRIHRRVLTPLEIDSLFHDRPLGETIANTARDRSGIEALKSYYVSAVDMETRAATGRLHDARRALRQAYDGVRELPVMREMKHPRPAYLLARGDYTQRGGDPVPRATPSALPPFPDGQQRDRLGLARWLTAPDHPLTARVHVNRVWQHFFGRGLVATTDNFGRQGEVPSHPELLDWLARDFVSHGWDMKRLCRMIVLSATYSQESIATPGLRERDPANILLARGPVKRLAGEALRDQALTLAGLLDPRIGGPPVKPYLPESATWRVLNSFLPQYKQDAPPDIYRRSLYTFWRRTAPPPGMLAFDVPNRDVCSVRRQQTNTPLQPLVTLNDPQFVEAARGMAIRMLRDGGSEPGVRIAWMFRETLGRPPSTEEVRLLTDLHEEQSRIFTAQPEQAAAFLKVGELAAPADIPAAELAAATVVASALLNLDETITLR
ncbi:MAG: DUF1553 domain-containing protein [Akkermansiaceae bacterium]|nr:DUF1553 domain-containing protein [Akkermansiaceae bacterium]